VSRRVPSTSKITAETWCAAAMVKASEQGAAASRRGAEWMSGMRSGWAGGARSPTGCRGEWNRTWRPFDKEDAVVVLRTVGVDAATT
jgi:hypothetical protein